MSDSLTVPGPRPLPWVPGALFAPPSVPAAPPPAPDSRYAPPELRLPAPGHPAIVATEQIGRRERHLSLLGVRLPKTKLRKATTRLVNPNVQANRLAVLERAIKEQLGPWAQGGQEIALADVKSFLKSQGQYALFNPDVAALLRALGYREHRAAELIACRAFVGFVGRGERPERGYQGMSREPNADHYAKVFAGRPERARWLQ
jgi:hypothetical protein